MLDIGQQDGLFWCRIGDNQIAQYPAVAAAFRYCGHDEDRAVRVEPNRRRGHLKPSKLLAQLIEFGRGEDACNGRVVADDLTDQGGDPFEGLADTVCPGLRENARAKRVEIANHAEPKPPASRSRKCWSASGR